MEGFCLNEGCEIFPEKKMEGESLYNLVVEFKQAGFDFLPWRGEALYREEYIINLLKDMLKKIGEDAKLKLSRECWIKTKALLNRWSDEKMFMDMLLDSELLEYEPEDEDYFFSESFD